MPEIEINEVSARNEPSRELLESAINVANSIRNGEIPEAQVVRLEDAIWEELKRYQDDEDLTLRHYRIQADGHYVAD